MFPYYSYFYLQAPPSCKSTSLNKAQDPIVKTNALYTATMSSGIPSLKILSEEQKFNAATVANKKYRGHHVLPEILMKDMEEAGMK